MSNTPIVTIVPEDLKDAANHHEACTFDNPFETGNFNAFNLGTRYQKTGLATLYIITSGAYGVDEPSYTQNPPRRPTGDSGELVDLAKVQDFVDVLDFYETFDFESPPVLDGTRILAVKSGSWQSVVAALGLTMVPEE